MLTEASASAFAKAPKASKWQGQRFIFGKNLASVVKGAVVQFSFQAVI